MVVLILFAVVGTACNAFAQPTLAPFPTAVISTSIPPTVALPTATLPPSLPGVPTLAPQPQPQVTLTSPTQTNQPQAKRISFAPGATSATVQGNLAPNSADVYVLRASAGQMMTAIITDTQGQVVLIIAGADGTVLKPEQDSTTGFRGTLPTTQDYIFTIRSLDIIASNYALQVTISSLAQEAPTPPTQLSVTPTRIAFPPGGTSATIQGTLPAFGLNPYVLRAFAGQTLTVNLTTNPAGIGFLVIYGADGNVLISDHAGAQTWSGALPTTQDYNIHVRTGPDVASYTLQVIIPPVSTIDPRPVPKRISFAPGATTATVQGNLATTMPDVYVLRASAGQVMAA